MGLFSTLSIGTRGLFASQMGMDIAGQNIANADVEGYSRKRLNMTADYRYDGTFGQMGMGVDVINIDRMRNALIDDQIRRQNQEVGFSDSIDHTLEQIENTLSEPGETGIQYHIDQFFDSWQNVVNNPSDLASRTMVKTSAQILNDVFHNVARELSILKQDINEKIRTKVELVNGIALQISNLNREVGTVEIGDQNANDSRDKRDLLVTELSRLIDVTAFENDLGQVTITSAGNMLVSPAGYRTLETTTSTFVLPDGTTGRNMGIRFADSKRSYMPQSGEINGLYEARDTVIPQYESRLDTLALALVQEVNQLHQQGYSLNGFTGMSFFDTTTTGASDIDISAEIKDDIQNIAAASAGAPLSGPPNNVAAGSGLLDFGNIGQLSNTQPRLWDVATDATSERARNVIRGTVLVTATLPPAVSPVTLTENVDYHIDYVQGTIQMLHGGYNGADFTIGYDYDTGQFNGPGDNSNAIQIAELRHAVTMTPDPLGNFTNTFTQYYSALIGDLGLARNEAAANLETREYLMSQYESHQDSIAGVSIDEEMADIIRLQHTYTAAARLISITSQMLDTLANL